MSNSNLRKFASRSLALSLVLSGVLSVSAPLAFAQQSNAGSSSSARSDGQIEMDVVKALDAQDALKNDWITAATVQGEVTISGTVASQDHLQLAASTIQKISGVVKVVNNLKVGDPSAMNTTGQPTGDEDTGTQAQQTQDSGQAQGQGQYQGQLSDNTSSPQSAPAYGQSQPAYGQQQGYYPPQQREQYAPSGSYPTQPKYDNRVFSNTPVTIAPGALLQLRTAEPVDAKHAVIGQPIQFNVVRDVYAGQYLAIPRGAVAHGVVSEAQKAGPLGGSPLIGIQLTAIDLGGQSIPVAADTFHVKGPNKAGRTAGNIIGGALLGAIIGGAVGRGSGAAIGAGSGAAVGTAASAATPGPNAWIPAEALVDFHLKNPLTVGPISPDEAHRLASSLRPVIQPRPVAYPGYYAAPPPPMYYRPYYVVGGGYYW